MRSKAALDRLTQPARDATRSPGRGGRAAALAALKRHKPDRALQTNVEFYTALLLEALGFPRDTFTRCSPSAASAAGSPTRANRRATGRLIRPKSRLYRARRPQRAA